MSHGAASEGTIEPNLTPLLDLVLQLLMFFMISVNFTQGVTNTGETLPHSETVAPLDADGSDPIILSVKPFRINMDGTPNKRDDFRYFTTEERKRLRARFEDGQVCVMIPTEQLTDDDKALGRTRDTLIRNMFNTGVHLKKLAEKQRKLREFETQNKVKHPQAKVDDQDNVTIPIHIRADGDVKTGDIYELMDLCKDAHFTTIKARALLGSGEKKK